MKSNKNTRVRNGRNNEYCLIILYTCTNAEKVNPNAASSFIDYLNGFLRTYT
jgi:hypothetical protein